MWAAQTARRSCLFQLKQGPALMLSEMRSLNRLPPQILDGSFLITNARHYDLLRRAADSLCAAKHLLESRASEDLILLGLYESLRFLGEITGETTPEDVLSQIFATFCIGK